MDLPRPGQPGYQEAFFRHQADESNDEFFRRFSTEPDWRGRTVLDVGCGHGALALRIASSGAARVVGVDLDAYRIKFACEKAEQAGLDDRCEFVCADVVSLDERFDFVVSKDTFEHVDDLPAMLTTLRELLKPNGQIWTGFSPLFYSPNGHHLRTGTRGLPWAHCLPWPIVRRLAGRQWHKHVRTHSDIGLNALTPAQFRAAVGSSGLRIASIRYNAGGRASLAVLSALRRVPGLERYATVSIYALLEA